MSWVDPIVPRAYTPWTTSYGPQELRALGYRPPDWTLPPRDTREPWAMCSIVEVAAWIGRDLEARAALAPKVAASLAWLERDFGRR